MKNKREEDLKDLLAEASSDIERIRLQIAYEIGAGAALRDLKIHLNEEGDKND